MNIMHIKSFWAVATTGSFTLAAEQLFTTQSTISKNIMTLESELGVKLFNRKGKYFSLTQAGTAMLGYYSEILETYDKSIFAIEEFKRKKTVPRQSLHIVGEFSMPRYGIINSLVRFSQLYGGVDLDIEETDEIHVQYALQAGRCDLVFCSDLCLDEDKFFWEEYHREGLIAIVSTSSDLSFRKSLQVAELAGKKLVMNLRESALYGLCFKTCTDAGFTPEVALLTANPTSAIEYVIGKPDCIYIAQRTATRGLAGPLTKHIPLIGFPEYNLVFAWNKKLTLPDSARNYMQFVREFTSKEFIEADILRRKAGRSYSD